MTATEILDAIERAYGGHYLMIRETGILCDLARSPSGRRVTVGRMDALLVPWSAKADCMVENTGTWFWDRPRLIAIEVKVARSDFLTGLREGQYERYTNQVSGLSLAVPRPDLPLDRVCKLKEVPKGVGLLTVKNYCRDSAVHCARRPRLRDVKFERDVPWRLLFEARKYLWQQIRDQQDSEIRMNERIGDAVAKAVAKLREELRS